MGAREEIEPNWLQILDLLGNLAGWEESTSSLLFLLYSFLLSLLFLLLIFFLFKRYKVGVASNISSASLYY